MWNMYGRNENGVALGFDIASLQSTGGTLFRCQYDDVEFRAKLHEIMEKCKRRTISSSATDIDIFMKYSKDSDVVKESDISPRRGV